MKENHTKLTQVLREWQVTSPLPPRFQEQVWQRIERADRPRVSLADFLRARIADAFARPAFAVAYVTALVTAGLVLGFQQANHQATQWDRQLEARYVQSIDPYQKVGEP